MGSFFSAMKSRPRSALRLIAATAAAAAGSGAVVLASCASPLRGVDARSDAPPSEERSDSKRDVSCVVDGHGPYDETWSSCLRLGRDQARARCALAGTDVDVVAVAQRGSSRKTARCRGRRVGDDCRSSCEDFVESPAFDGSNGPNQAR